MAQAHRVIETCSINESLQLAQAKTKPVRQHLEVSNCSLAILSDKVVSLWRLGV